MQKVYGFNYFFYDPNLNNKRNKLQFQELNYHVQIQYFPEPS